MGAQWKQFKGAPNGYEVGEIMERRLICDFHSANEQERRDQFWLFCRILVKKWKDTKG